MHGILKALITIKSSLLILTMTTAILFALQYKNVCSKAIVTLIMAGIPFLLLFLLKLVRIDQFC